uniref:CD-NTase associated protein 4-like DNA endonuclease domain-containing protein n=1 Tax=Candidatus Methanogaster sp. ANME-2c ERB4 TaxID=2759911 RepID=A0A7G9Y8J4_9EURY|nr:hypothetical protein JKAPHALJ_00015 [Methanosarcinales archaeon ANME-2c ERB4]QNO46489.1 hypothetical protein PAACNKLE_00025 [Methanosarcinales archaeon ANME-2c ERB4]
MSADRLIHDATASTKGTIYQLCVAVQKCYEMIAGQKVLIECQGDITIPNSQQVETKHYSDTLTDNHPNIWKTLQNWMQDDFDAEPYTSLILYTTQQFGERAAISRWNGATSQERLEIIEAIHRQAEERKSERQNKASNMFLLQRDVLDLSRRDKLTQVIEKFVIEACSPTLPELHTVIKQQYIKGILDGKKDDFLDALIGFITQAPATREQRWEITYDRFDKKVGDLNNLYCRETRVFPRKHFNSAKLPDGHQVDAHRDHAFVQKIQDIEYLPVIREAVRDYQGTVQTINGEFKNYEVPPSRTKNYADELVEIFEKHYRVASRKCTGIIADSQSFFDSVTVEEPREFEGFDRPPMAFRNGLLHTQLDDEEKDLRWRLENI